MGVKLTGPIALLFPGQGVQKPGMGRNLHDRYPAARRVFERAEEVLQMPVRRLCFEGPLEDLNRTDVIQPCVMTVCWAAYEVWRESYGFENVSVTAGHSLGEIASLAAAAFRKVVDRLQLTAPSIPVLANASGEAMRTVAALQDELRQQMLRQVDWARTMVSMRAMKVRTVVELGPGRVLASLAAKHIPGVDTWNAEELFIDFADNPATA